VNIGVMQRSADVLESSFGERHNRQELAGGLHSPLVFRDSPILPTLSGHSFLQR